MTDAPIKRRKIRPNNVIALTKASKQAPLPPPPAAHEEPAVEKEKVTVEKEQPTEKKSKEAKSEEKAQRKATRKAERKATRKAERKATRKAEKRKAKAMESDVEQNESMEQTEITPVVVEHVVETTSPEPKLSTPAIRSYSSASDSDETDDEKRTLYAEKIKQQKEAALHKAAQRQKKKVVEKKSIIPDTQSDSDSELETLEKKNDPKEIKLDDKHRNVSHLVSNRISFRKTREIDDKKTPAENVAERLSDLFVPEVKDNYFISDSESETDSGEDYDTRKYPTWQRNLNLAHNKKTDPWPVQRKFGYSDTLKLEKRIKKICRREGITFQAVQEIFTQERRSEHIRLFQKIAKPFPNVSLHALARQCKNMYHQKRKSAPWTPEEIVQLEELIKVYGQKPIVLSQHMERSPKNISDYLFSHVATDKKILKRWSAEEDAMLAKEASKLDLTAKRLNYTNIEKKFEGTRTPKQIHARLAKIRHLIQPDGTLEEKRSATPYEELKYLKQLLAQVKEHKLAEESQLDYTKNRGYVDRKFYLNNRILIKDFETMNIKDILKQLIEKQHKVIESRKAEKLLGSDPEPDQD